MPCRCIHDYIAMTVKYKDTEAPYSHEAPGAVLYQIGVCEGIAKAFKYLSDQLGLQSVVVFGASNEQGNEGGHSRFKFVEADILKDRPVRNGRVLPVEAADFKTKIAIYLPEQA